MKYDIVFANGCSFVQGSALGGKNLPSEPVKDVPNRFSDLLAKHFDAEECNIAAGGSGNDKIFRTSFDWIEQNKERIEDKKILICLGLSFPQRSEIYSVSKGGYTKFNVYSDGNVAERISKESKVLDADQVKEFARVWFTEFYDIDERIKIQYKLIKSLLAYINQEIPNYDLFIFNSLEDDYPDWFRNGLGLDDTFNPSWNSYIQKNKLNPEGMWHPLEKAHADMAKYIIQKYG